MRAQDPTTLRGVLTEVKVCPCPKELASLLFHILFFFFLNQGHDWKGPILMHTLCFYDLLETTKIPNLFALGRLSDKISRLLSTQVIEQVVDV